MEPECNRLSALTAPDCKRSLEPRLMHLLCYLAANAPAVLSREQLIGELWPRVIVNDNSLTRAVSELRRQLKSQDQRGLVYIETIPKKGYRLLPDVVRVDRTQSGSSACGRQGLPSSQVRVEQSLHTRAQRLASWLVVVALGLSLWQGLPAVPVSLQSHGTGTDQQLAQPSNPPLPLAGAEARLASLSSDTGETIFPLAASMALSADGSVLALLRHEEDRSQIYLLRKDGDGQPVLIFSSNETLSNLQWSPVGYALLFARLPSGMVPTRLDSVDARADLVLLDLQTMTLKTLIDNSRRSGEPAAAV